MSKLFRLLQTATYRKLSAEDGLKLISKIAPKEGMKVLDLGCGTGYLSGVLTEHVGPTGSVVGVDPDSERIQLAREIYKETVNLRFLEGSSDTFPEGQYDIVFSNYVLHLVKDKEAAFARIHRSLKPGGVFGFVATLKHHHYFDQLLDAISGERKALAYNRIHFKPREHYQSLAASLDFRINYDDCFFLNHQFENIQSLIEFWYVITQGIFDPEEADQRKLDEFKKQFGNKPVQFNLSYNQLMVVQKQ